MTTSPISSECKRIPEHLCAALPLKTSSLSQQSMPTSQYSHAMENCSKCSCMTFKLHQMYSMHPNPLNINPMTWWSCQSPLQWSGCSCCTWNAGVNLIFLELISNFSQVWRRLRRSTRFGRPWKWRSYRCSKWCSVWTLRLNWHWNSRNCIRKHLFDVLIYASKHDFASMADEAAEYSCSTPLNALLDLNGKYLHAFVGLLINWTTHP